MSQPTFPVPIEFMDARIDFADFRAGDTFSPFSGTVMKTAALNHPNGATGYRIEHAGKSLCYVTDTEHVVGKLDDAILGLIQGADLVIYDSTYTDKEFPNHIGWGAFNLGRRRPAVHRDGSQDIGNFSPRSGS